jgi:phosphohistidine phosphatase SixA
MFFLKIFSICLLGIVVCVVMNVNADQESLIEQMKSGGHILMIRHAYAPGSGDPANFQIGDCSTQRNLDDRGRMQARAIGEWLREKGIKKARIYSSQWCRCLETAELLKLGDVTELSALNSFYDRPQDRVPNLKALQEFISEQARDGELIIMVTHFVTISAITGEGVSSGEGVVLHLKEGANYDFIDRLSFGF